MMGLTFLLNKDFWRKESNAMDRDRQKKIEEAVNKIIWRLDA